MADLEQERTEEATEQRREDFRKRGQVAQTRELATVLILLSATLTLWALGRFFLTQIVEVFTQSFGPYLLDAARNGDYVPATLFALKATLMILGPLFAIVTIVGVMSTVVQVGFLHNEEALQFKWEKLNPVEGLMRIFSWKSLVEGLKSVLKLVLIAAAMYYILYDQIMTLPNLVQLSVSQMFSLVGDTTLKLLGGIALFMTALALLDYFFQRWDLEKQMRMTKQEVKEELKSREGDPLIKARIRRIQREMANKRMMADVPKADVVLVNPTHIAVALRYDPQTMAAPQVIAKGAGAIADKIKELAREHSIPILENKPLARTIYKTLKIGQTIPRELFTAVAQVLSYVYRLKKKVIR